MSLFPGGGCSALGTTLKITGCSPWSVSGTGSSSLCSWDARVGVESTQQLGCTTGNPWTWDLWIPVQNVISHFNQERLFSSGLCIKKYNYAYSLFIGKGWHLNSVWVPAITLHLSNSFPTETDSCSGCLTLLSPFPLILRGLKSLESYNHANFVIHWNSLFASS